MATPSISHQYYLMAALPSRTRRVCFYCVIGVRCETVRTVGGNHPLSLPVRNRISIRHLLCCIVEFDMKQCSVCSRPDTSVSTYATAPQTCQVACFVRYKRVNFILIRERTIQLDCGANKPSNVSNPILTLNLGLHNQIRFYSRKW